jgi:hypothetical protein
MLVVAREWRRLRQLRATFRAWAAATAVVAAEAAWPEAMAAMQGGRPCLPGPHSGDRSITLHFEQAFLPSCPGGCRELLGGVAPPRVESRPGRARGPQRARPRQALNAAVRAGPLGDQESTKRGSARPANAAAAAHRQSLAVGTSFKREVQASRTCGVSQPQQKQRQQTRLPPPRRPPSSKQHAHRGTRSHPELSTGHAQSREGGDSGEGDGNPAGPGMIVGQPTGAGDAACSHTISATPCQPASCSASCHLTAAPTAAQQRGGSLTLLQAITQRPFGDAGVFGLVGQSAAVDRAA